MKTIPLFLILFCLLCTIPTCVISAEAKASVPETSQVMPNTSTTQFSTIHPRSAAPGHADSPAIFWAHFMPQVAWGFLHAGGHVGGNADVFPFETQAGSAEDRMYKAMKYALESGINGFQFLTIVPTESYAAAARLTKETGQMFYLAPVWCDMGDDLEKAVNRIVNFVKATDDNPHVYKKDGKQLHFLYNHGKWSGSGGDYQSQTLPAARELMRQQGVDVYLIPTVGDTIKVMLDRMDRNYSAFPPFVPSTPGEFKWLRETNWDGATGLNGNANARHANVLDIKQRLSELDKPFFFVPSIRSMYDSSNRYWQAIHCRGLGLRVIQRDLRLWIDEGFRLFTFSTWNDVNETMLMPSSRNVFGLNQLVRYYLQIAENGRSPFQETKFVVSYEPEVLLGDQGFFQFLVLPEQDTFSSDYIANVDFRTPDDEDLFTIGLLAQVDREDTESLAENRFDSSLIKTKHKVIVPYLTVLRKDKLSGAAMTLYNAVRLPPIRIRYNKLHYYTPYTIALDHIDTSGSMQLNWIDHTNDNSDNNKNTNFRHQQIGDIMQLQLNLTGDTDYRRVNLAESCLSLGAFRADDLPADTTNYFLRLAADPPVKLEIALDSGIIDTIYRPHWDNKRILQQPKQSKVELDVVSDYRSVPTVARLTGLTPDSQLTVRIASQEPPFFTATIAELAKNPGLCQVTQNEQTSFVTLRLTTDVTDPNYDFPVSAEATLQRPLVLAAGHESMRVFHAWSLSKDDKIRYSNPVIISTVDPELTREVEYIQTGGVFDDFVNDNSSHCVNAFSSANIRKATLPLMLLPEFVLNFDDSGGKFVNHHGTAHQLGWGWLEGDTEWVDAGWRGSALKIGNGKLNLRSKLMPHGSLTVSLRVNFDNNVTTERALFEDADYYKMELSGPLALALNKLGQVVVWRPISGAEAKITSSVALQAGWNHLLATYDLEQLKLYVNGQLAGVVDTAVPTYARTHSAPKLGVSKVIEKIDQDLKFQGVIDDLRILGYALTAEEVTKLADLPTQTIFNSHPAP